jgi:sulfofructose kinase
VTGAANRPRILVVGYNAYDVTVPVAGGTAPAAGIADTKIRTDGMLTGGGGPGATAAVALARLGAAVSLATVFAGDELGEAHARDLERAGVSLDHAVRGARGRSPLAVILVDPAAEARTIYWTRGPLPHLASDAVPPAALDHCDMLYVDGHEPEASLRLAAEARRRGLPVVMDAGSVREGTAELVRLCTDVIGARGFARELTGRDDPLEALRALREMGPERVGTTFGHGGVLGLDGDGAKVAPAIAVAVLDTTGAGDAFHAGYAFARASGRCFAASLGLGCAVAALKCTGWGGRRTLPGLAAADRLAAGGQLRPVAPEIAHLA